MTTVVDIPDENALLLEDPGILTEIVNITCNPHGNDRCYCDVIRQVGSVNEWGGYFGRDKDCGRQLYVRKNRQFIWRDDYKTVALECAINTYINVCNICYINGYGKNATFVMKHSDQRRELREHLHIAMTWLKPAKGYTEKFDFDHFTAMLNKYVEVTRAAKTSGTDEDVNKSTALLEAINDYLKRVTETPFTIKMLARTH